MMGTSKRDRDIATQRRTEILFMRVNGFTLEQVGAASGLTRERIRQIQEAAGVDRRARILSSMWLTFGPPDPDDWWHQGLGALYQREKEQIQAIRDILTRCNEIGLDPARLTYRAKLQ